MEGEVNEPRAIRNELGQFVPGVSGNPSGRPSNTLKDYVRRKLDKMTDDEKEAWLESHKIAGIDQWKMAEGQPKQDVAVEGEMTTKIISADE